MPTYEPIDDRSVWTGAELEADRSWEHHLTDAQIEELEAALAANADTPLSHITRADFELPTVARLLADIGHEIRDGRGISVIRGLPVERYELAELEKLYWGLCIHLGTGMTQNSDASLIHYVTDGKLRPNQGIRGVGNPGKSGLHVDLTDCVSLLCVRQAPDNPPSWLASSARIYNEFVANHPEHLNRLFDGFEWDRLDEQRDGEGVTSGYRVPVFSEAVGANGRRLLSCRYNRYWMAKAILRTAERVPEDIWSLFGTFDEIAESVRLNVDFAPGDIQFANNYTVLHGRDGHAVVDDEEHKRVLMRIWLDFDEARPTSNEAIVRYGIARHGALGWTVDQFNEGKHLGLHERDPRTRIPVVSPSPAGA